MSYPNGWLIRMKQFLKRPYDQFMTIENEFDEMKKDVTLYTSYGNFDRIEFLPVDRFSEYQDKISIDDKWYGKRQSIILYAIKNSTRLFQTKLVNSGTEQSLFKEMADGSLDKMNCRFFIHTMVYVSGAAKSEIESYQVFLHLIEQNIQKVVSSYRKNKANKNEILECEVFGTFNSAEIAIIWAADQFTDVLYLLDQFRYFRFEKNTEAGDKAEKKVYLIT